MNILFILNTPPVDTKGGFDLHFYNIMVQLKKRGHNSYLIYLNKSKKKDYIYDKLIKSGLVAKTFLLESPKEKSLTFKRISEYLYKFTHIKLFSYYKMNYNQVIKSVIEKYQIDLVHIGSVEPFYRINLNLDTPHVIDLGDSYALFELRRYRKEQNLIKEFKYFIRYIYNKRIEELIMKKNRFITVVSEVDKHMLLSFSKGNIIFIIPNGVDVDFYSPSKTQRIAKPYHPIVLFHGVMNFSPNINSAFYIAKEIFPLIKQKSSGCKFYIVGRDPSDKILQLQQNEDIIVTGYVEDIRGYLMAADVILEPIISGSGIKNKLLEAMSMGKAVVTNPLGCEGLNQNIRKNLLIGKNEEEIAQYTIGLLRNNEIREEIGRKNRKLIKKFYTWTKIIKMYEELYQTVLNSQ